MTSSISLFTIQFQEFDLTAVQILESSCPRCEPRQPHQQEISWSHEEELFQMCLQRVLWALGYTKSVSVSQH